MLQEWLLQRYGNPEEEQECSCGSGYKLVRCRWDGCFQYPTSCENCFIKSHRHNPFHWALVWDKERKIWVRRDYSRLGNGNFIQIGHFGDNSSCSGTSGIIDFVITDTNGVHSSRVRFCHCSGKPNKAEQLIRADLFPATPRDPVSAFTIAVLKHFRMHNLQSKCGAFDFIMSIRRLTNNISTHEVPVSSRLLFLLLSHD